MSDVKKVERKSLALIKAYKNVFESHEGQLVLKDLMKAHHMLAPSFKGDAVKAVFSEGERNVVLRILTILKTDVGQLLERINANARDEE